MNIDLSIASRLAYELAVGETNGLQQQFILPELMVIGVTKLEDLLSEVHAQIFGIPSELIPLYKSEAVVVLDILQNNGIIVREFRRRLRKEIGMGGYRRQKDEPTSRDERTRECFTKATELAAQEELPLVPLTYMLAALLEVEDTALDVVLKEYNTDRNTLHVAVMENDIRDKIIDAHQAIRDVASESGNSPKSSVLDSVGRDITQLARDGKLNRTIGRDQQIRDTLIALNTRHGKASVLLIGDAGVGKTSIVEGVASAIAQKARNIPAYFHNKRIIQINAGSLVANTTLRGEFEARMTEIIREASSDPDLILFIDEIHMLAGAGSGGGNQMDAFNLLKEPLARGEIRLIGATTESEFRRHILTDDALERRFMRITVPELSEKDALGVLLQSKASIEQMYELTITDEAIHATVEYSVRYMPNRKLPDKAFELLNRACADLGFEVDIDPNLDRTLQRYHIEQSIPQGIEPGRKFEQIDIAKMADWLKHRVIGQDKAADAIVDAVKRRYVGFGDDRPIGVFLFVGPTGVGKTEMARAAAEFLFGSPDNMIRIDMSEYMERHTISRLIGAAPGYVGYEQGGQLTGPLMTRPKSVILLDEIEKAHDDIRNLFLQAFDAGRLTDGQGHVVNTREAIFIMTSNLGVEPGMPPNEDYIMQTVEFRLRPEFRNRLDGIIVFRSLEPEHLRQITRLQIEDLRNMLMNRYRIDLQISDDAIQYIAEQGETSILGVRPIIRFIDKEVRSKIADLIVEDRIFETDKLMISFTGLELSFTRKLSDTA